MTSEGRQVEVEVCPEQHQPETVPVCKEIPVPVLHYRHGSKFSLLDIQNVLCGSQLATSKWLESVFSLSGTVRRTGSKRNR